MQARPHCVRARHRPYQRTVAEIILPRWAKPKPGVGACGLAWGHLQFALREMVLRLAERPGREVLQGFRKASDKYHMGSIVRCMMAMMDAALDAVRNGQSSLKRAGERISGSSPQPPDSVVLSTEMVAILAARNQFQDNVGVLQLEGKKQKQPLDIQG